MSLTDLLHSTNTSNDKGLAQVGYIILRSSITTFPAKTTPVVNVADRITRTGTFTLANAAFFKRIVTNAGTGEMLITRQGGVRQGTHQTTVEINRANLDADVAGWIDANQNQEFVLVWPDRNGLQRIVGDEAEGCFIIESEQKTGKAAGDDRGTMIKFQYSGPQPTIWTGTPQLS